MKTERRVALSFLAHPDDAEFLCAGTLIRLADAGWTIHIATATPGDCGTMNHDRWEIRSIRTRENLAWRRRSGQIPLPRRARRVVDTTSRASRGDRLFEGLAVVVFTHASRLQRTTRWSRSSPAGEIHVRGRRKA